jgi:hypothetical protein
MVEPSGIALSGSFSMGFPCVLDAGFTVEDLTLHLLVCISGCCQCNRSSIYFWSTCSLVMRAFFDIVIVVVVGGCRVACMSRAKTWLESNGPWLGVVDLLQQESHV